MAADFAAGGSPLYAHLARRAAEDRLVGQIVGELHWDVPLRLMGGVHYLVLAGEAPEVERAYRGAPEEAWEPFRRALAEHRDRLSRFVAEQPVQTNEVRRSWGLLPAFLTAARAMGERPLDLVELGPSAGLNLVWDRYRYRYGSREWGPPGAKLRLDGELRGGEPGAELLATRPHVRSRLGIDRHPVDVTTEHGARLLEAFVWADQPERLERLRRAIEVVREDPPRLVEADYVEVLPVVLAARDLDALTVVYHSASAVYLRSAERARVRAAIEAEGARGGLAWISAEAPPEGWDEYHGYAVEVQTWPPGERVRLARLDGHAKWLEWLAA